MWIDDNGPVMQSMYFFYGLGTIFSPLICLHFLSDTNFVDENYQSVSQFANSTQSGTLEASLASNITRMGLRAAHPPTYFFPLLKRQIVLGTFVESSIEIPYFIVAGMLLITAIVHVLCHFFWRYQAHEQATILHLKNPHH